MNIETAWQKFLEVLFGEEVVGLVDTQLVWELMQGVLGGRERCVVGVHFGFMKLEVGYPATQKEVGEFSWPTEAQIPKIVSKALEKLRQAYHSRKRL